MKTSRVTQERLAELVEYVGSQPLLRLEITHSDRPMHVQDKGARGMKGVPANWSITIVAGEELDFAESARTFHSVLDKAVEWSRGRRAIKDSHENYEESDGDYEEDEEEVKAVAPKYAERVNSLGEPKQIMDTMPQWLYHRFGPAGVADWDKLSPSDQAFWRHEAEAVKRAVARGGFKIDW